MEQQENEDSILADLEVTRERFNEIEEQSVKGGSLGLTVKEFNAWTAISMTRITSKTGSPDLTTARLWQGKPAVPDVNMPEISAFYDDDVPDLVDLKMTTSKDIKKFV